MSELEKQLRDQHEKWRKKWTKIQTIVVCALAFLTLISSFTFVGIKKNTYVPYVENGNVIHRAYLGDNEFYDENYLNGTHAYVSSLIDKMTADFSYDLEMAATDVRFQYTYRVDAQIEIKDKASNSPIFNPVETILPTTTKVAEGKSLSIKELITLDYNEYNSIAKDFVDSYNVKNTENTLIVRMHVDVVGMSESFTKDSTGEYVIELHVPLLETTVKPSVSTTIPAGVQMIVAKDTTAQTVFMVLAIVFGSLTLIGTAWICVFIVFTRNKHIYYARKVKGLVTNYKAYIQEILDEYDTTGYQVIRVARFTELLEIRDTIRQPIFMYENEDKTATKFFIVTCVNSIHIYEVKVEDDPEGEAEYKLKPFILFVAGSWEKTKAFVKKACDRIKVFTIKVFRKIKEVTVKLFNKIKAFVKKLFTKSNKQDSQDSQELPEIQEPEETQEPQEIQELKHPTQKNKNRKNKKPRRKQKPRKKKRKKSRKKQNNYKAII